MLNGKYSTGYRHRLLAGTVLYSSDSVLFVVLRFLTPRIFGWVEQWWNTGGTLWWRLVAGGRRPCTGMSAFRFVECQAREADPRTIQDGERSESNGAVVALLLRNLVDPSVGVRLLYYSQ